MSYAAALDRLHTRTAELHVAPGQTRHKFRLEEMQTLVAALGQPQQRFRSVLIAGTNGKGSASATLSSILLAAGYRSGLYTSPHLDRVNERIRIAGTPISDADFARHYFRVDDCAGQLVSEGKLPAPPSFFETLTALAFSAFAEAGIDLAVLEVGMGGRLDATNVVDPLLSVITDISLDHMEWLGHTIPEIAREKAGILRPNGTLVTLPQHPEANQAIGEVAVALNVRGVNAAEYVPAFAGPVENSALRNRYPVTVLGEAIEVDSPLAGAHQRRNIALAIAAAVELTQHHGFSITPAHIELGIRQTRWPGRLERIAIPGKAELLLDVAHNPAGAWALRAALSSLDDEPTHRKVLVFGCMQDKAYEEMAQILFPLFDLVVATSVASPRSATVEEILAAADKTGTPAIAAHDGRESLEKAWAATTAKDRIVVAGSVYLVGEVRPLLVPAETTP
ncbi:MAG TPA: folylpolyglutamate synthase/dihydrofolate synthase family protein [Acidobacteriaceae bacterium]|nr:folylpolyglutamate synthase/dihydrofolate synthase family protein [Acidobacteriaceae bacterium]